jgi:O-antigen/teichoic acid export membrane protein
LLIAAFVLFRAEPSGPMAVGLQAGAAALACAAGIIMARRALPTEALSAQAEYHTAAWLRSALPFVLLLGMNVIVNYTDVVMLGSMIGAAPAGIYRAASQLANLIAFPLTAVQLAFAPVIASLYAAHDFHSLQAQTTRAAFTILVVALPAFLVFILFGGWILLLFGEDFSTGYDSLAILSGGYLVNAAMGPSGYLLIMTKHERAAAAIFGCSAAINIIGNLALIPILGIDGAATATASSLIFVSIAFAILAWRQLGIQPTILSVRLLARLGQPK